MKKLLSQVKKVKFEVDNEIILLYIDDRKHFVTFVENDFVHTVIINNPNQYVDEYIANQLDINVDNVSIIETSNFNLLRLRKEF